MYDYAANNEDELSFSKGQLINVMNKDDPDWWQGEISGVTGLFPSNYVKMTTDSDPSQQWPNVVFQLWKHPRDPLSKFDSSVEAGQAALIKYLLHNSFTSLEC